jgi:hypothetical protein
LKRLSLAAVVVAAFFAIAASLSGCDRKEGSARGWAVGGKGTVLATANGGATWRRQKSDTTRDLNGVSFIDASRGWAVGNDGAIIATSDGGRSWRSERSGTSVDLTSIAFADASHGLIVGDNETILAAPTVVAAGGSSTPGRRASPCSVSRTPMPSTPGRLATTPRSSPRPTAAIPGRHRCPARLRLIS